MSRRVFIAAILWLSCAISFGATYTHQARLRPDNYNSAVVGNTTAQISVVYGYGNDLTTARTELMAAAGSASCQQLWQAYRNAYNWSFGYPGFSGITVDSSFPSSAFECAYANGQKLALQFSVSSGTYTVCPPNSTQTGSTCICNSGYVDQGGQCVQNLADCSPGRVVSGGYFDGGTSLSGGPRAAACDGGCLSVFDGEFPSGSALQSGVKHYYGKGTYVTTGFTCDSGAGVGIDGGEGNMPASSASVPSDTCAQGQVQGTVNGKTVCVNQETGNVVPSTSGNQTTSTSSTSTVTNPDGSRTDTTTTTTTAVDGTSTTTTTTTNYRPDGSVSGSTSQSSGTGVDEEAEDDIAGSNDASGFYEKKDLSVASIFGEARDALVASPIGSSVTGFFNISGGGSCPSMTWDVPLFNASAAVDTFCSQGAANMYLVIRGVVLLIAGLMAFRIAIDF